LDGLVLVAADGDAEVEEGEDEAVVAEEGGFVEGGGEGGGLGTPGATPGVVGEEGLELGGFLGAGELGGL
jgi:hypothetical protein